MLFRLERSDACSARRQMSTARQAKSVGFGYTPTNGLSPLPPPTYICLETYDMMRVQSMVA